MVRRLFPGGLSVLFAWCIACPVGSAAEALSKVPPIALQVAFGLPKPPYISASGKGGLEVEIVEQALAATGYHVVPVYLPPTRARVMVLAGELEAMSTVTEEFGGDGFYSKPYIVYHNVAISLAKRKLEIRTPDELAQYSVAAFQNARLMLGERFGAMSAVNPNYTEYARQVLQNRMLMTGRVDVVVGDRLIFAALMEELGSAIDVSQPVTIHEIFAPSPRRMLFRSASVRDDFNRGFEQIERNGTVTLLYRKYQGGRAGS
jgi:polar amino acid transport system substrate-binding protein